MVGWTLISRVLGLVRDVLSAARFGAGAVWDAFTFAWTFPNTFRRLLGEGALASAFIPTLAEVRENEGSEGAARLINAVFTVLLASLVIITLVSLAPLLFIPADVLDGVVNVAKLDLIMRLLQVMVPYLILICMTAFLGAVLQTHGKFAAPAAAPVLLNLAWIGALFLICPYMGVTPEQQIFGVAFGVLIGGGLQVLVCLPPLWKLGIRVRPTLDLSHPGLRKMLWLMLPVILGMAPTQINILLDRLIAEALIPGNGAISALYYGTRLMQFPLALVGVAMATAVLPTLSRLATQSDEAETRGTMSSAVSMTSFVAIPAAVGLGVLAAPIVRFLFEHGAFEPRATASASRVIWAYAPGIPVICVLQVVTRAFYARGDTSTPVRVAFVAMVCNLVLNLVLVGPMQEAGLALATSLAAVVNLGLLLVALRARIGDFLGPGFFVGRMRVVLVSIVMGAICFLVYTVLERGRGGDGILGDALAALVPVAVGVLVFVLGSALLRVPEYREIRRVFGERR